jgi:RNA polymerase sigma-70 factor (ECF subfamily)
MIRLRGADAHFDQVVRAYSGELYHFALWLTRDRHRAEDALQEALARAWRGWSRVHDEAARKGWLYAIVRNECFRDARRGQRREEGMDDEALAQVADERDFTMGLEVRDLLLRLPAGALEPLMLQALGGFTCEEVAEVLGISAGAVATRISRARSALRRLAKLADAPPMLASETVP